MNYALKDLSMAGVCWELNEEPIKNVTNQYPGLQNPRTNPVNTETTVIVPPSAPISLDNAKSMAEKTDSLESLIQTIREFNHPLRGGTTNVVLPNIANEPNGLLIITDFPSNDDDLSGRVLSGNAGDMVDKMLSAIEMSRKNVSILPLLFWRTPGGRTPTREELDLSMPFVNKTIDMLNPHVIITFGTLATNEIAKSNLNDSHGKEITDNNGRIIIPMYHPNYLILKPSAKRDVWTALQNVEKLLKNV
jgi:DNA polymerase